MGGRSTIKRRGFTLLETALATVIIGVGVLALVEAQQTFYHHNEWSSQSATGTYLCNELRERIRTLPRHDPVTGLYTSTSGATTTVVGWGKETAETVVADFDDVDDWDGIVFGAGGTMPGPIDGEGSVIEEIGPDGAVVLNTEQQAVPLKGWSQRVLVEKVDPFNFSTVRATSYSVAASGSFAGLTVDRFPLRVSITTFYQGPLDTTSREMARVVWIMPP